MVPPLPRQVAITGWGLCCALGTDPAAVARALALGATGLREHPPLRDLPGGPLAGVVDGPDLRPWLKRRKDRKLLARSAELALAAAGPALGDWPGDRTELGLFVGVGREPPDDGESEAALVAVARDGVLDEGLLAGPGRDLYPPLLPLRTLPNLVLAHVSINLDICGENGTWGGGTTAGLRAITAAIRAVAEGRCEAALAGGADSLVDVGNARDRLRLGGSGAPGEAAAFVRVESLDAAWKRGARLLALVEPTTPEADGRPHHGDALGDCGAANGAIELLLAVASTLLTGQHAHLSLGDSGHPPIALQVCALKAC